jgi:hypothetical protein
MASRLSVFSTPWMILSPQRTTKQMALGSAQNAPTGSIDVAFVLKKFKTFHYGEVIP